MVSPLLKDFPVVVEFPIAWGEMDAFQHVNNVAYFRYFENARIVYSEKLGLHAYKEQTGIGPILGSVCCRFKLPLTYPDTLLVGAKTVDIEEDRFTLKHVVVSQQHGAIAAEGEGVIVTFNYHEGRKTAMPDEIRKRILDLEKTAAG